MLFDVVLFLRLAQKQHNINLSSLFQMLILDFEQTYPDTKSEIFMSYFIEIKYNFFGITLQTQEITPVVKLRSYVNKRKIH